MAKSKKRKPNFKMRLNAWIYIHENLAEALEYKSTDEDFLGVRLAN